ncbi:MAG: TIGR00725 family protein [candidate division Zixibacteria bacterium]|nr:TIGR00725 family protein [candidate division Zixibacteria bacterium]
MTNPERKYYIGVIGAGQCSPVVKKLAFEVGRQIAKSNAILVCGGLGGVMESAAEGAKSEGGATIGILPGRNRGDANRFIDLAIPTGIGEARNLVVINASDAIVALPGKFGTLSEFGFALKLNKPVVNMGGWDLKEAAVSSDNPEEAVRLVLQKIAAK